MADDDRSPEDDFQELLRRLLGGAGADFDPEQLQRMTGMNFDPGMLQQMMNQLQGAFAGDGAIAWDAGLRQALHIANQDGHAVTSAQQADLTQAFTLANLWLSEATAISDLASAPGTITRGDWVERTFPVWQELAEPVATSITDALMQTLSEQAPEEMQSMIQGAGRVMRSIGGSLFATQLGQVIGNLSKEVVSGGDVGIPLLPAGEAAILPQNFADVSAGLEVPQDQVALYLATRELAHARLFRHAKWLRLHVLTQVTEYARGLQVDTSALEDLAERFDPANPEELRAAIESGALLPRRSEAQNAALARLENLLATIEGWVDVVTADATARLPETVRLAEATRRRRAVGGPAERALGALVGLEIRPRRLREAAAMWRTVTDAVGAAQRDALWDVPDFLPTAEDIDNPQQLVDRLVARSDGETPRDAFDEALDALLAQAAQDASDDATPNADESGDESPSGPDEGPGGPQPV